MCEGVLYSIMDMKEKCVILPLTTEPIKLGGNVNEVGKNLQGGTALAFR
jgi:hypothetical protein